MKLYSRSTLLIISLIYIYIYIITMVNSDANSVELLNCVILMLHIIIYSTLIYESWSWSGHDSRVKMSPNYFYLFLFSFFLFYELTICTCTRIVEAANYIFNTISNPLYPNSFYIWLLIRFKQTFWLSLLLLFFLFFYFFIFMKAHTFWLGKSSCFCLKFVASEFCFVCCEPVTLGIEKEHSTLFS